MITAKKGGKKRQRGGFESLHMRGFPLYFPDGTSQSGIRTTSSTVTEQVSVGKVRKRGENKRARVKGRALKNTCRLHPFREFQQNGIRVGERQSCSCTSYCQRQIDWFPKVATVLSAEIYT